MDSPLPQKYTIQVSETRFQNWKKRVPFKFRVFDADIMLQIILQKYLQIQIQDNLKHDIRIENAELERYSFLPVLETCP
jgi:hypothetical protein